VGGEFVVNKHSRVDRPYGTSPEGDKLKCNQSEMLNHSCMDGTAWKPVRGVVNSTMALNKIDDIKTEIMVCCEHLDVFCCFFFGKIPPICVPPTMHG
jgi:hypothetical protein